MSTFGSPGGQNFNLSRPTAPERGSFPLDHDGECKTYMSSYLSCLKRNRGVNDDECRKISKAYLVCRMDNNLMARDEMKNLGYASFDAPTLQKGDGKEAVESAAKAVGMSGQPSEKTG